jgi:hypothetical protein
MKIGKENGIFGIKYSKFFSLVILIYSFMKKCYEIDEEYY